MTACSNGTCRPSSRDRSSGAERIDRLPRSVSLTEHRFDDSIADCSVVVASSSNILHDQGRGNNAAIEGACEGGVVGGLNGTVGHGASWLVDDNNLEGGQGGRPGSLVPAAFAPGSGADLINSDWITL